MGEAEYVRTRCKQTQTSALDVGNDKAGVPILRSEGVAVELQLIGHWTP